MEKVLQQQCNNDHCIGVVVGVLDTGVNFVHTDIVQKYRGYKTSRTFTHG
jgi:hypothetical protein